MLSPRKPLYLWIFLAFGLGAFFLAQQLLILGAWTSVPYVDSWVVFDRYMHLSQRQMSLPEYIFSPHGSHLHSIVYFIYALDICFFSGRQFLPLFVSLVCTLIVDALFLFAFFTAIKDKNPPPVLALLAAATGIFFINAPSGANLHIFQVVLVASRAAFAGLLLGMIYTIRNRKWGWHAVLLALSAVATTFHGSGMLFAVTIIVLHIVASRDIKLWLVSLVPLISVVTLEKILMPPGASEFSAIVTVLGSLDIGKVLDIALGTAGYYASPLVNFWQANSFLPNPALLAIGAVIMLATILPSLQVFWKIQGGRSGEQPNTGAFFMALLSFLVFISAVSSALFWAGRKEISADKTPVYLSTIFSARYACFASLAWAHSLFLAIVCCRKKAMLLARYGFVAAMLALALYFFVFVFSNREKSFNIDASATRILADPGNPLPAINAYSWREVAQDSYWRDELPKTVQFMKEKKLSFFYGLPEMGQNTAGAGMSSIANVKLAKIPDANARCRLEGTTVKVRKNIFQGPRIMAVAGADYHVVGYAAIFPGSNGASNLVGTVACGNSNQAPELYLLRADGVPAEQSYHGAS